MSSPVSKYLFKVNIDNSRKTLIGAVVISWSLLWAAIWKMNFIAFAIDIEHFFAGMAENKLLGVSLFKKCQRILSWSLNCWLWGYIEQLESLRYVSNWLDVTAKTLFKILMWKGLTKGYTESKKYFFVTVFASCFRFINC